MNMQAIILPDDKNVVKYVARSKKSHTAYAYFFVGNGSFPRVISLKIT